MSHKAVPSRLFTLTRLLPGLGREETSPEATLVARVRANEKDAFRTLFDRYGPPVWRFLRDLVDDGHFADEAVQETFIRAYDRIAQLRDDARLQGWLFGIARNVAYEHLRAQRRDRPKGSQELEWDTLSAEESTSPEVLLLGREAESLISRALNVLSDDRRAALLMRVDHGLPYEEICSAMGWSLPKVKNEIHRARLQLRTELARLHGGEA